MFKFSINSVTILIFLIKINGIFDENLGFSMKIFIFQGKFQFFNESFDNFDICEENFNIFIVNFQFLLKISIFSGV